MINVLKIKNNRELLAAKAYLEDYIESLRINVRTGDLKTENILFRKLHGVIIVENISWVTDDKKKKEYKFSEMTEFAEKLKEEFYSTFGELEDGEKFQTVNEYGGTDYNIYQKLHGEDYKEKFCFEKAYNKITKMAANRKVFRIR